MARWVLEQENQQGTPLRLAELQVLAELVRERRATTPELARVVQRTDAETRNILARMVERPSGRRLDTRADSPPGGSLAPKPPASQDPEPGRSTRGAGLRNMHMLMYVHVDAPAADSHRR
jgi:hypothetical protein